MRKLKIALIQLDLVMGTRVLLSVLRQAGYEVKLLQLNIRYTDIPSTEDLNVIYDYVEGSAVVGIAFNTLHAVAAEQICCFLKEKGIEYIIAGGNHATAVPDEVIVYSDIVVKYEAEITLPMVLEALDKKKIDLSHIKGIVYKRGNAIFYNHEAPDIEFDLDTVPFQSIDTSLIKFFNPERKIYTPDIGELFHPTEKRYFILASRGCPFECSYCSNSLYHKLDRSFIPVRKRSIDNIIGEMKYAVLNNFDSFYITDDNFFSFTLQEIAYFSKRYKEEIRKPFSVVGINPNNFRSKSSEQKIKLLLACGLSDVRIGLQSGSDKTLSIFNRRYKSAEIRRLLQPLEHHRKTIWPAPYDTLHVVLDFICDAIWEEEEDKMATIKLALNVLSQYSVFFFTLVYLPGTKIYDEAVANGWIKNTKRDICMRGIAGVDDNIYNRILFLIAVAKERGVTIPERIIDHILQISRSSNELAEELIDFFIDCFNGIEKHHNVSLKHAALHPYLAGFNKWTKIAGDVGRKVLFRSYHQPYG